MVEDDENEQWVRWVRARRYLSAGLGASGLLGLADNHVPWWGLLLWSILALTVIALQTVMPQDPATATAFSAWPKRSCWR